MSGSDRRFIEETFPVKEVGAEAATEKSIRHGHISTLHIWWARRPLASSRATNYAALIGPPEGIGEWNKKRNFIIELSKWKNSLNPGLLEQASKDILKEYGGKPPRVLDPFAGGGAIPLEALRLGCETYSSDLNPVAVLIQKCTLEYPQRYGRPKAVEQDWGMMTGSSLKNPLVEDVKTWGNWVLEEARRDIGSFYLQGGNVRMPVGYVWARTIPCQNPACGTEIPLMRQYWLARKAKNKVALFPYDNNGEVLFKVVGNGYGGMPDAFDPYRGTISRAVATCPVCGSVVDADTTRRLFGEKVAGQRMVAVVLDHPGKHGKTYRIAQKQDVGIFEQARVRADEKRRQLMGEWGIDPVPDEILPPKESHRAVGSQLPLYDFKTWGDLFNPRQKLALITFAEKVRIGYEKMLQAGYAQPRAKVVATYLALAVDRLADKNATLVVYNAPGEKIEHVFGRQALPMVWDYAEVNPFTNVGWPNMIDWICRVIQHCSQASDVPATITQSSATSLEYPDDYFDAVFTDPPYYDNVPYSYLSDFFYVWLKRTVGDLYPELFSTPLTPKTNEIVVYANRAGGKAEANRFFESSLKQSFQEIHRVLKPDGIATIVYAHKSTAGWETLINSLLDSGLIVTGAWPLRTEMESRLTAKDTASLASSIYIIARKMDREPTGFYNDVKEELKKHLDKKLERLWEEGVGGADFFIAAIGSAIEVFGKYEQVMDYEGNILRADRLLEDVRKIATDYAVRQILHDGFSAEVSDLTRFYVLYRWNYGAVRVQFDEARKLAQSCGIDLAREWARPGFVTKQKEFIRVLGPQDRKLEALKKSPEMIDILHAVLLLWEKGKRDEMMNLLQRSGYAESEAFYRVAQAVSETLPIDNKEKKLLDGFLAGRQRLREEAAKYHVQQRRLFE